MRIADCGFQIADFKRRLALLLVALLAFSAAACAQKKPALRTIHVLFIGNSYTYYNELPILFARLAQAGGQAKVETKMVAPGGWTLRQHWDGGTREPLALGHWDYVVLQEQSLLGAGANINGQLHVGSDAAFQESAKQWAEEVHANSATPVFYLTWARKASAEDQSLLTNAYTRAARESHSMVAPVGIAWAQVREQQPAIELFQSDGSHPSRAGTYLAACTFYATIFDKSPVGLPAAGLPPDQAHALQVAAWAAWQQIKQNET